MSGDLDKIRVSVLGADGLRTPVIGVRHELPAGIDYDPLPVISDDGRAHTVECNLVGARMQSRCLPECWCQQ